ncbi:MAG: SAM-dependent methyltransferase [Gammaproteobacteria bacterium]|nr:SAM-dependent methyltransferase [Gammaproteobacteria bacterium]
MIADSQHTGLSLPTPDEFALKLSQKLREKISLAIMENGGSIGFEQYMQMALYEPALGYYSAGSSKFGEQGDFVTAPEISPIFSRCLAKQCQQVLSEISSGCILELGPGTGVMAIDILRELERNNVLPGIYYMLEPSADLRQRQQQNVKNEIPHLEERIIWLEHLPEKKIEGVILANEVIDAMPVKRIVFDHEIEEYAVTCVAESGDKTRFQWIKKEFDQKSMNFVQELLDTLKESLPTPYTTEINFYIKPWLNSLNDILNKGLILISDYGYPRQEFFHPQRHAGTLICHYRHHAHDDPFLYPGLQDITASVDFTAVAEAAVDIGLHVSGFTTQAHFLIACGLDEFVSDYEADDVAKRVEITHQVSKLTMPGEMGEKFKFIGLTKKLETKALDIQLIGFNFIDQRARL